MACSLSICVQPNGRTLPKARRRRLYAQTICRRRRRRLGSRSFPPLGLTYSARRRHPSPHRRLSHHRLATPIRARVPVGEAVRPCRSGILAPRRRANLTRISYILDRKAALVLVPFFGTTNAPACARILAATLLGEATTGPKNGPGFGVGKWTCFWVRKTDQG